MYIAAFMQTFRKFTEHLGMASFDPLQGTRTVLPRKWLLRLSSFLNFDIFIHGPHHRHPRLTHTTLEEKLGEYQRDNPEVNYPAYERYWKAMLAMFPSMIFNPGCGVNAGNTDGHFAAPRRGGRFRQRRRADRRQSGDALGVVAMARDDSGSMHLPAMVVTRAGCSATKAPKSCNR